MTGIFHSDNLDKDFKDFQKALFETNKYKYSITVQLKPILRKYYSFIYIIALIESKLEKKYSAENKLLFINEIVSDSLTNLSICFIGFYYSSQILFRRAIENFYNHSYYFDHPIEFELLNLGKNEYVKIVELKRYFEEYPIIQKQADKNIKIFNDQLFQHYHELCKTVHTKGEGFMNLAKNLEEIKPTFDISIHIENMNKSMESMSYLLFKFHHELSYTNVEKNIISGAFQKSLRKSLLS